jgi:hypothetical protein
MEEMEERSVVPAGVLRWGQLEYWLINPHPVKLDWESDNQQVFWVVPKSDQFGLDKSNEYLVYPHSRHVVVSTQLSMVEYSGWLPPIKVRDYKHFADEE